MLSVGRCEASCAGIAPMPRAGRTVSPSQSILKINSNMRLDDFNSPSRRIPPKNGRKKRWMNSSEKPADTSIFRGALRALENLLDRGGTQAGAQAQHAKLVEEAAEIGAQRFVPTARRAPGIDKLVHASGKPGKNTGREFFQFQGVIVERALSLGIRGEQDLEAAIQQKSFNLVSADAAANAVRSFNDLKRDTDVGQMTCAGQAGKSCTDNQNIRTVGHLYGGPHKSPLPPRDSPGNAEQVQLRVKLHGCKAK